VVGDVRRVRAAARHAAWLFVACGLVDLGTFVDGTDTIDQELEDEADAYAARILLPPKAVAQLPDLTTLGAVQEFAKSVGVADGVVVGRMQHDGLIPHSQWPAAFVRYKFDDDR
jgi:Zn-dependent peptidase ImmA (M78 family)